MKLVAVLEKPGEYFGEAVSRTLGSGDNVLILDTSREADLKNRRCDLVVVSPGYARSKSPSESLNCGALLTPDGLFFTPSGAKSVVTYGMSSRSTLTLSSIGAERCVMAIQRNVMTASGKLVEEQEMTVMPNGDADTTLAAAGGRILLGLSANPQSYISNNTV